MERDPRERFEASDAFTRAVILEPMTERLSADELRAILDLAIAAQRT